MTIRELITRIGFKVDPSGIEEANKRVENFEARVKKASQQVRNFGLGFTAVVSAPLALMGISSLKTASNFEQLQVAFETFLGSADKAKTTISDLTEFAKQTPFNLTNVQEAAKRLLAYGTTAEDLVPTLRMVGDIASGVGVEKLPNLITALGQVKGATVLTGMELRQFTETGVALMPALAKVTGLQVKQIINDTKGLGITYDQVLQALKNLTSEGGLYYNLMAKQAETLGGQYSNLEDSVTTLKAQFGALFSDEAKWVIKFLKEMIDKIGKLDPRIKKIIGYFSIFLIVLGPVITAIGQLGLAVVGAGALLESFGVIAGLVSLPLLAIAACIGIISAAIYLVYDDFKAYFDGRGSILGILVDFGKGFLQWGAGIGDSFKLLFNKIFDDLVTTVKNMNDFVMNPISGIRKVFNGAYKNNYKTGSYSDAFGGIKDAFKADYNPTREGFNPLSQGLWDFNEKMNGSLSNIGPKKVTVDQIINGSVNQATGGNTGPSWFDFMNGIQNLTSTKPPATIGGVSTSVTGTQKSGVNVILNQQVKVDVSNMDAKEIGDQVKQQTEEAINSKLVAALRDLSSPEVA